MPSAFGAEGPNQHTSQIQYKEVNRILFIVQLVPIDSEMNSPQSEPHDPGQSPTQEDMHGTPEGSHVTQGSALQPSLQSHGGAVSDVLDWVKIPYDKEAMKAAPGT